MTPEDVETVILPETISLVEPPTTKRACIDFLIDLADEAGRVEDRDAVLDAVLARESKSATGVGEGIAIPHSRTDAVPRSTIAFCRSFDGVDFGGPNAEPARLIFLLLVPGDCPETHNEVLGALSRALVRESVRDGLLSTSEANRAHALLVDAVRKAAGKSQPTNSEV
jgi:PTS system fructose-specific IIA component